MLASGYVHYGVILLIFESVKKMKSEIFKTLSKYNEIIK